MKKTSIFLLGLAMSAMASAQIQRTPTPNDNLISVKTNPDSSVTFSIYAPNAQSVGLTGDIAARGVVFTKAENGVWSATVPTVSAGAYRYAFTVDGLQVFDPKYSRLGEIRPVTEILPESGEIFWQQKDVPHGAMAKVWYDSKTTGSQRRMHVWTPAGYNASTESLPVFYLIHGGGDNDASWPGVGKAGDILDNLMAEGKMKPCIVVMPDGSIDTQKFVDDLAGDLIPYIEKNYRVKTGAENRALAGLSMGGLETLESFMNHPDMFAYINVMSSGWFVSNQQMYEDGEKRLKAIKPTMDKTVKYLKFTMGGKADIAYENCQGMLKVFDKLGYKYEYTEMDGGHSWYVWRHDLYNFAQQIFK